VRSRILNCLGILLSVALTAALAHPLPAQENPDLNSILDSLERMEAQDPAFTRAHDVTREYKLFRNDDPTPTTDVTAQVHFMPPDTKTFEIIEAQGNQRGKKIIAAMLDQEVASAKDRTRQDISRRNYSFIFVREQNFGMGTEYVLHITPKRKDTSLLVGDIWVDAKTYRIRQIIGIPIVNPSFWIKDLHFNIQFTVVEGMWILASVDAIATVRFLGVYTLSGVNLERTSGSERTNH
jgi:hypothetical protein